MSTLFAFTVTQRSRIACGLDFPQRSPYLTSRYLNELPGVYRLPISSTSTLLCPAMTISPAIPLPPLTRVAVIGAGGPSGLVAVKQLLEAGVPASKILAFEARKQAGGVWNYEADPGPIDIAWRKNGPPLVRAEAEIAAPGANGPSAMYDKLRTNLPNEVMNYRSHPFPKGTPVFPTHQEVVKYLQDYADQEGLVPLIHWGTRVTDVHHTGGAEEGWTVETESAQGRATYHVSHVIVANGHYNEPYLPHIPGLDSFTGKILHSRWWRNPRSHRGENIVVVGSRASGSDIARELAVDDTSAGCKRQNQRRTIYQSVRGLSPGDQVWDDDFPWAKRIHVVPEIERIDGNKLHLVNGETITADTIVFATGYLYSYPFLRGAPFDKYPVTTSIAEAEDGIPAAGGHDITNLNTSDTFYVPDPTLAFIGLHYQVNPFPLGEATARLIAYSFTHDKIPPLPPLLRASDRPNDIKIGAPQEFDNQDAWLAAIGEGGDDGGENNGWPKTSEAVRTARMNALKTRKQILGY